MGTRGHWRSRWLAALMVLAAACGTTSRSDQAIDVLVNGRGMDRGIAECIVARLDQRGVDLDVIGDGAVVAIENPELIEVTAACAAALAVG